MLVKRHSFVLARNCNQEPEVEIESRHSAMGHGFPSRHLNLWTKCLHCRFSLNLNNLAVKSDLGTQKKETSDYTRVNYPNPT